MGPFLDRLSLSVEKIKKRMSIVSKIVEKHTSSQIQLESKTKDIISKVFEMINLIDWISYFLAIENNIDPSPVKNIEKLKTLIGK